MKKVAALKKVGVYNFTGYRRMPPVIAPWTKIALIKSAANKAFIYDMLHSHLLRFEHVIQRILILLEPKLIRSL